MALEARQNGKDLQDVERETLGVCHAQAGSILAAAWGFPENLERLLSGHHSPDGVPASSLASILRLARSAVKMAGVGRAGNDHVLECDSKTLQAASISPDLWKVILYKTIEQTQEVCNHFEIKWIQNPILRPSPQVKLTFEVLGSSTVVASSLSAFECFGHTILRGDPIQTPGDVLVVVNPEPEVVRRISELRESHKVVITVWTTEPHADLAIALDRAGVPILLYAPTPLDMAEAVVRASRERKTPGHR
jgi:hypothetical protein